MKKNNIKNRYRLALACYSNIRTSMHADLAGVHTTKIMSKVYNVISKCPSFQSELFNQMLHNFNGNLREALMPPRVQTFSRVSFFDFSFVTTRVVVQGGKPIKQMVPMNNTQRLFREVEGLRIPVEFKKDVLKAHSKIYLQLF